MSGEDLLLLREIKERIQQLFGLYEILEAKNNEYVREIANLTEKIESLNLGKEELRKEIENLKFSKIIASGYDDSREAKKRINGLLREIEQCIALLNR